MEHFAHVERGIWTESLDIIMVAGGCRCYHSVTSKLGPLDSKMPDAGAPAVNENLGLRLIVWVRLRSNYSPMGFLVLASEVQPIPIGQDGTMLAQESYN
jgi:hypothetical protein